MRHNLKTWPEFFRACKSGDKTFELRYNDRNYKVGDEINLREFDPCKSCKGKGRVCIAPWGDTSRKDPPCPDCRGSGGRYTGDYSYHVVTYVLAEHPGIYQGYVILGLAKYKRVDRDSI